MLIERALALTRRLGKLESRIDALLISLNEVLLLNDKELVNQFFQGASTASHGSFELYL